MKRVLITGAAGFIGSHLADRLLARGDTVAGVDNFDPFYDPAIKRRNLAGALAHKAYEFYELDIRDQARVTELFEAVRPDVVVHLAARAGVRPSLEDPNLYHKVNIIGSQHILDACRAYEPSHLVFASSSSVYGGSTDVPFTEENPVARPVSPYAATKRMNELMGHVYHHVYGLRVTMLRFFTVYGPRQRPEMAIHKFTRLIDNGEPIPMFGDGTSQRDYTFVDDIMDGLTKAVDTPFDFEIFNLGESRTTALKDLIAMIAGALGKEVQIKNLPFQSSDMVVTYANIDKARRMLGYAPCVQIEEGVERFVAWYREQSKLT
ncbi:MAG: NAD-dependent epimerase/dehydratase family protein [bacterium]|nr:NAD-dependent epimerase/dehydratase family protein [bacterium]